MNTVLPIIDFNLILMIKACLKSKNERDYLLFMFGIYTGFRISDILPLKVEDIRDKDVLYIIEKKTQKQRRLPINKELKVSIKSYVKDKKDYEYLFSQTNNPYKPITRQRVWQILNNVAKEVNYSEKIGCHTMRKTFGYWLYKSTGDVVSIKEILNQSSIEVTKRYIGITQKNNDKLVRDLSFKI